MGLRSATHVALVSRADARDAIADARSRGADLICLPHLSFGPYTAASRDRCGLEQAERSPAKSWRAAVAAADGASLAASAYESEGEGVFYVTARLGRADQSASLEYRQIHLEAGNGRFEQMFWSPGYWPQHVADQAWGRTGLLVGLDLRTPNAWAELARGGARVVLGGASEPRDLWERTRRVASGMAAAYGLTVLIANREGRQDGVQFAGGGAAFGSDGGPLAPDGNGLFAIPTLL